MKKQVRDLDSLIQRNSGTSENNPWCTLNEDAAMKQLKENPTGVIEACESLGISWERVFNQIRDWAEMVSFEI